MKTLIIISISLLLVCCSAPYHTTNGRGSYRAPIMVGGRDIEHVTKLESQWIDLKYPEGFIILGRRTVHRSSGDFHVVKIISHGRKDTFYFEYTCD